MSRRSSDGVEVKVQRVACDDTDARQEPYGTFTLNMIERIALE